MASFLEALDAEVTKKGPQCAVCKVLDDAAEGDRAAIDAALASDRQHTHIARALARFTGDTAWIGRHGSVARHRRQHMR